MDKNLENHKKLIIKFIEIDKDKKSEPEVSIGDPEEHMPYLSALLYVAAKKGNLKLVENLLKYTNLSINGMEDSHSTLLAAIKGYERSPIKNKSQYLEIIKLLLNDERINTYGSNPTICSPFFYAVENNLTEIFKLLIDRDVNIHEEKASERYSRPDLYSIYNVKYNPLTLAIMNNNLEMVMSLLEKSKNLIEYIPRVPEFNQKPYPRFNKLSDWAKYYMKEELEEGNSNTICIIALIERYEKDLELSKTKS